MLELKNITYQHQTGNKKILNKLNLKIKENDFGLIYGSSGSGKTTLLEIISGLNNQQYGEIFWRGKSLSSRQRRWNCGVVFQFPERYFIGSTIGAELKFGHKSLKGKEISNALLKVGLSKVRLTMAPEKLSGGEQRRLAVAVQLLRNPDIILFDEPTAGLDWSMKNDVKVLIKGLKKTTTIIVVSHEPKIFEDLTSNIFSLEKGRLNIINGQKID